MRRCRPAGAWVLQQVGLYRYGVPTGLDAWTEDQQPVLQATGLGNDAQAPAKTWTRRRASGLNSRLHLGPPAVSFCASIAEVSKENI
jgi:hypothetical protein